MEGVIALAMTDSVEQRVMPCSDPRCDNLFAFDDEFIEEIHDAVEKASG